jgi:starch synthase
MRYGTVPVATKTGGLKDTIIDYIENAQQGNGFLSDSQAGVTYDEALKRSLSFFSKPSQWDEIRRNGMKGDYSWSRSAKEYAKVYKKLVGK